MNATAAHAAARCDPETATRCVRPRIRKSSSVSVPIRRRLSPRTIPSARSPPAPGTPCIRTSMAARHANSGPSGPVRHAPVSARQAVPVAQTPERATRRAQGSPRGRGLRIAEKRTVRPRSGTASPSGHPMRTWAPSSGPPRTRTRTTAPYSPSMASASTTPVHSRAPQSAATVHSSAQARNCNAERHAPAVAPEHTTSSTASVPARRAPRRPNRAVSASTAHTAANTTAAETE